MSKAILCIFGVFALSCVASADLPRCPQVESENKETLIFPADECNAFYECANGAPYLLFCPEGLYYDVLLKVCNYEQNVNCGKRNKPEEIVPYKQ